MTVKKRLKIWISATLLCFHLISGGSSFTTDRSESDDFSSVVRQLSAKLDAVNLRLDGIDRAINSFDQQVTWLEEAFGRNTQLLEQHSDQIKTLTCKYETLNQTTYEMDAILDKEVYGLQQAFVRQSVTLAEHKNQLNATKNAIEELRQAIRDPLTG